MKFTNLLKNYGFLIIFLILLFYLITVFIFCLSSYIKLKKDVKNIFLSLKFINNEVKKENKITKRFSKKYQRKKNKKKKEEKNEEIKYDINNDDNPIDLSNTKNSKRKNNSKRITENIDDNPSKKTNKTKILKSVDINKLNNKYIKELLKTKDFELNSLEYEEAIKLDKRNFWEYYFSLIKNNHPLIFSFGCYQDYNSKIIKIFLFFYSFILDLTINALFFNDDTMHKIYEDKGKFNFLYHIPQIMYSTLISKFIDGFIRKLVLSQDNIVELKQEKEKIKLKKKYIRTKKYLKRNLLLSF